MVEGLAPTLSLVFSFAALGARSGGRSGAAVVGDNLESHGLSKETFCGLSQGLKLALDPVSVKSIADPDPQGAIGSFEKARSVERAEKRSILLLGKGLQAIHHRGEGNIVQAACSGWRCG